MPPEVLTALPEELDIESKGTQEKQVSPPDIDTGTNLADEFLNKLGVQEGSTKEDILAYPGYAEIVGSISQGNLSSKEFQFYQQLHTEISTSSTAIRTQLEKLITDVPLIDGVRNSVKKILPESKHSSFDAALDYGFNEMLPDKLLADLALSKAEVLTSEEDRAELIAALDILTKIGPQSDRVAEGVALEDINEVPLKRFGAGAIIAGNALVRAAEIALEEGNLSDKDKKLVSALRIKGRKQMIRGKVMSDMSIGVTELKLVSIRQEDSPLSADERIAKGHEQTRYTDAMHIHNELQRDNVREAFFDKLRNAQRLKPTPRASRLAKELARTSIKELLEKKYLEDQADKEPDELRKSRALKKLYNQYVSSDKMGLIDAPEPIKGIVALTKTLQEQSSMSQELADRLAAMLIAANYVHRLHPAVLPDGDFADLAAADALTKLGQDGSFSVDDALRTRYNATIPRLVRNALGDFPERDSTKSATVQRLGRVTAPTKLTSASFDPSVGGF